MMVLAMTAQHNSEKELENQQTKFPCVVGMSVYVYKWFPPPVNKIRNFLTSTSDLTCSSFCTIKIKGSFANDFNEDRIKPLVSKNAYSILN